MKAHTRLSAARVAQGDNLGDVVPWLSHLEWLRRAACGERRWSVEVWGRSSDATLDGGCWGLDGGGVDRKRSCARTEVAGRFAGKW
jgi:hypothetical protein